MATNKEKTIQQLMSALSDVETWQPYELKFFGPSTRTISFFGEVDRNATLAFISQVLHLVEEAEDEPITVWLNTEGGSLTDGLAIYDCLKNIPCPVIIYTTGICASAGLIILSAGDYRVASQSCTFYYHEPVISETAVTSAKDMQQLKDYYASCKNKMNEIIKETTGIKKKLWDKYFEGSTSYYFNSQQALKINLIDKIAASGKLDFEFSEEEDDEEYDE